MGKAYGAIRALGDLSLAIPAGEVHALCGHNGAGKSTLVKMLAGLVRPDRGEIRIDGTAVALRSPQLAQRHGIALVDQEISLIDCLSIADNVMLGLQDAPFVRRRRSSEQFARGLLERVGLERLDPGTPVGSLTIGERQLVEIARALGRDASVLILDEPTATLSEGETERVFDAVRSVAGEGGTVVFVSHRLGEVLSNCDRITVLRDGEHVATEAASELDRARLINLMLGHQPEPPPAPRRTEHAGPATLSIRELEAVPALEPFSLEVPAGQIVALAGQVGSGATDVLRVLAGLDPRASGEVVVDGHRLALGAPRRSLQAGLAFLSNDRKSEGLFLDRSVASNLIATRLRDLSRGGIVASGQARRLAAELADNVGLTPVLQTPAGNLSGGNQQKAFLGRALGREQTRALLLDEPTRGVDVGGRAEIHELVRSAAAEGKSVLFASTELDEIFDLADVIVTMCAGRVTSVRPRSETSPREVLGEMTHVERGAAAGAPA